MDEMSVFKDKAIKPKISIIGVPGSGKTTQSAMLSNTLGMLHVSSGDLVRQYLTDQSTKDELSVGKFAPDHEAVINLVRSAISNAESYVLDGFPRMVNHIENMNISITAVVHLNVPDDVAIDRLLRRNRSDDTLDVIKARMMLYYQLTEPVLGYFRQTNTMIIEIDGNKPQTDVWGDIVHSLNGLTQDSH